MKTIKEFIRVTRGLLFAGTVVAFALKLWDFWDRAMPDGYGLCDLLKAALAFGIAAAALILAAFAFFFGQIE